MWTVCVDSLHTRTVHEVLNDLEEKFRLACVPESEESAQYIVAHAIGHKTVSLSIYIQHVTLSQGTLSVS